MSKVESIDPEKVRDSRVYPLLEEIKPIFEITNETTQWLETGIALLQPESRHFAIDYLIKCDFHLGTQKHFTLDGFLHAYHRVSDSVNQSVVSC